MDKNKYFDRAQYKSLKIEFTIQNLFTITLFFLSLYFLWAVRNVALILFIAFIISSSLAPIVNWMEKKKIKRNLAVILIYIVAVLLFAGASFLILFPLTSQLSDFFQRLPEITSKFIDKIEPFLGKYFPNELDGNLSSLVTDFAGQAVSISGSLFEVIKQAMGVMGIVVGLISIMILSIYMLIEHDKAVSAVLTLLPLTNRVKALKIITEIEDQMGRWLRGQFFLCFIIGAMTWISVTLLGFSSYAFPLALIAGCLEIIPNLGPTLAGIPAFALAIAVGNPFQMIATPIVYWLIQQIENTYIVPQVMRKAVGLNPLITMVAFLVGAEVAGVPGTLLAVPVAAVVQIFIKEMREK